MIELKKVLGDTYLRQTLENGLNVIIYPKKEFNGSLISLGVNFGGAHTNFNYINEMGEEIEKHIPYGVAHFLEHLLFSGEDDLQFYDLFNKFNIVTNAYTSLAHTTFEARIINNNFFERILNALLKMVLFPKFSNARIETERKIIYQESDEVLSKWYTQLLYSALSNVYSKKESIYPVTGTAKSISTITKELLLECHKVFYHPSYMTIIVIGDVNPQEVLEYLNKFFNRYDFGEPLKYKFNDIKPDLPEQKDRYIRTSLLEYQDVFGNICKDSLHTDVAVVLKLTPNWNSINNKPKLDLRDYIALEFLHILFFVQQYNSEVIRELQKNQLVCTPSYTSFNSSYNYSNFVIYFSCVEFDKKYAQRLIKELRNFPQKRISKEKFEMAKRIIYARALADFDSSKKLKDQILEYQYYSKSDIAEYLDYLKYFTQEQFKDILEKIFEKHYFTIVTLE